MINLPKQVNIPEHDINKEDNMFIGGYYLPDELIDPLVEWTNSFKLIGGTSMQGGTNELETWDGESEQAKECYEQGIIWPTCNEPILQEFLDATQTCMDVYTDKYSMLKNSGAFKMDPNFNFQKYPKGKSYNGWHCERADYVTTKRMLVWMCYLNDCEDGGETAFLYQRYKMKPEKGLLLFWPSDFTHTHRGLPSYKTEKMIMTGWYSYITKGGDGLSWG